ncbi:MAG: tetratricopeptide repeat protein [Bryobacteraceae bacterium]|nr:tetratricopeptide repeat protein [Bryobacteraceae bacterium]MCX7605585.1 tetratricopeptide repeat protein [Bryobacteraceae bacterium]
MTKHFLCFLILSWASAQPPQPNAPEFIREGQKLVRAGQLEEALALYRRELEKDPSNTAALNAAGVVLDLLGRTSEARQYFQKSADAAPDEQGRAVAWRQMAMSYAFDNDCANSARYGRMLYDYWLKRGNHYAAGEAANEVARVCIEAGALDEAEKLYRLGTEVGLQEPNISAERRALWQFRLEHALARLAARRGQKDAALKHVAAARKLLDENPEMARQQEPFFPYLAGYVALYTGDAQGALEHLKKANQNDPFIQCLMGMAYEKLGQKDEATACWRRAVQTTAHNPPAAFARPFARKKLGGQ